MTRADAAERERVSALAGYDIIDVAADDPVIGELNAVCQVAAALVGAPTAAVNLIDDRIQHQVAAFGVGPADCERAESLCQTTLAAGDDLYVPDASADPRLSSSPWVDGRIASIRLYCSTILHTPSGHAIGTLCAFDESPHEVSKDQLGALRLLARQVVVVLELRRRTRQLERSQSELSHAQEWLVSFAGQLGHDLKAPLTAILGFAELLEELDGVVADPVAAAYVGRCTSAARRMLGMVDDLLASVHVGGPAVNLRAGRPPTATPPATGPPGG